MQLIVILDYLIRDVVCCYCKVASRPHVPSLSMPFNST